jgi:hypothetical protein
MGMGLALRRYAGREDAGTVDPGEVDIVTIPHGWFGLGFAWKKEV